MIFIVGLIVFGPRKLPEIGKSLGKMVADFKRASSDFQRTVEDEIETEKIQKSLPKDSDFALLNEPETNAAVPQLRAAEGSVSQSDIESSPGS